MLIASLVCQPSPLSTLTLGFSLSSYLSQSGLVSLSICFFVPSLLTLSLDSASDLALSFLEVYLKLRMKW